MNSFIFNHRFFFLLKSYTYAQWEQSPCELGFCSTNERAIVILDPVDALLFSKNGVKTAAAAAHLNLRQIE